jgi:hypothetical protein
MLRLGIFLLVILGELALAGRSAAIFMVGLGSLSFWSQTRPLTVVTAETISIRELFRTRHLTIDDCKELLHPGRFDGRVRLVLKAGPPVHLPRVEPDGIQDIHQLTGLPVRITPLAS